MAVSGLGSQYGNYNPAAVDPYPIESVLAAKAAPDSAQAQSMLDLYQMQRQANANIYGQELDKQHEFNRQQLAQQLYEAQMKTGAEYAKLPGGARFASQMPGADVSGSPEAWANFANQSDRSQQVVDLSHLGTADQAFSTAGVPIPEASLQGMTGLPFKQGTRPDITIQGMKDASKLAAANISAGGKGPKFEVTSSLPFEANSEQSQLKTSGLRSAADAAAALEMHRQLAEGVTARRQGTATPPAGGSGSQLDTNSPNGKAAQNNAMRLLNDADKAAKAGDKNAAAAAANIRGAMKGGVITTQAMPNGKTYAVGKDGRGYEIGG